MFLVVVLLVSVMGDPISLLPKRPKCEPITVSMCQSLPYNVTTFPNLVNNEEQSEAQLQLRTFRPLLQAHCSSQLQFFLCSVYVPMCTDKITTSIGPCRPLCENVRSRCEPILSQFGFPWPASLNCSKFPPENNAITMCMRGPEDEDTEPLPRVPLHIPHPSHKDTNYHNPNGPYLPCPSSTSTTTWIYINRTDACALECRGTGPYSSYQRQTAHSVVFATALITITLAAVNIFVQIVFRGSWKSLPEVAMVLITVCYGFGSVAYIIRWAMGRDETACVAYGRTQVHVVSGLQQITCTVVAIVMYYFGAAARMWWLVLCWTWLTIAGLGKTRKEIDHYKFYLHVVSWGLPVVQLFVVLVQQAAEADFLTGLCSVGEQNKTQLLWLVLVPELGMAVIGLVLLLVGLLCLHISEPKLTPDKTSATPGETTDHSLPRLLPTGVVAGIYLPISGTLCVCYIYMMNDKGSMVTVLIKHIVLLMYGLVVSVWCIYCRVLAVPCVRESAHLTKLESHPQHNLQHQLQPMLTSFPPSHSSTVSPFHTLLPSQNNYTNSWRHPNR